MEKRNTQVAIAKIVFTTVDFFYNWARANSIWPLTYATSCCAIEMMCTGASHFDMARFGCEVYRATPRQSDLMITAGTVTHKMAPAMLRLYEQMPEPKYVIAMGACTVTGGMYENDSYSVVRGVDRILPVDVYLPGCPPRPEALLDAIRLLQKKMQTESLLERKQFLEAHKPKVKLPPEGSEVIHPIPGLEVMHWGVQVDGYDQDQIPLKRADLVK